MPGVASGNHALLPRSVGVARALPPSWGLNFRRRPVGASLEMICRRDLETRPAAKDQAQLAHELKNARFALWKHPGNPPERQQLKLVASSEAQPAAPPRLPALSAVQADLPRSHWPRARAPRLLAEMGTAVPAPAARQGRPSDHRASPNGPGGHHQQALHRPRRAGQQPDPPLPGAASVSTDRRPSSPSSCSHSAASVHHYRAGDTLSWTRSLQAHERRGEMARYRAAGPAALRKAARNALGQLEGIRLRYVPEVEIDDRPVNYQGHWSW